MNIFSELNNWFWTESFWLPQNSTWDILKRTPENNFGQTNDFIMILPSALVIFCIRLVIESTIARRIGIKLGLSKPTGELPSPNVVLEKVFVSITKKPDKMQVDGLCKQLNWSRRRVLAWFRKRNSVGKSSTLVKFCETFWRFVFYFLSFLYGIYVLHDEECIFNRIKCWENYPNNHQVSTKIYRYYMLELAFYTSTTATQFFDIKRKDFWEMFIHHIVTIILLMGSYVMNYTKIGAFIVLVHDSADFYLEFAKMARYTNYRNTTNVAFGLFTLAFWASRLTILPFWIIPTIWYDSMEGYNLWSAMYVLFSALLILQFLHFYWFSHIVRVVYSSVLVGEIKKDTRSDSENDVSTEGDNRTEISNEVGDVSGDFNDTNSLHRRNVSNK